MFFLSIAILIVLFIILGKGAELVVNNLKVLAKSMGIPIAALGLILGFVTSLPEIAIATTATIEGVSELALGNLFGATIVLFCLILGFSILVNRGIATDGHAAGLSAATVYFIMPIMLGLDGAIDTLDGFVLLFSFIPLIILLFKPHHKHLNVEFTVVQQHSLLRNIIFAISGALVVVVASDLIVRQTESLLAGTDISPFIIGLLVFGIGTNLPELTIALTAWRKHTTELSVSNLVGSAVTNILIIGVMASARPLAITVGPSFFSIGIFLLVSGALVTWFVHTDKKLSAKEGLALVGVYVAFLATQLIFLA